MPTLHRMNCGRCSKAFFTYDSDRAYCTHTCEAKKKYEEQHPTHIRRAFKEPKPCKNCGEKVPGKANYCGYNCIRQMAKKKSVEDSVTTPIRTKRGRPKPYHVLNEMEEKKRLRSLR